MPPLLAHQSVCISPYICLRLASSVSPRASHQQACRTVSFFQALSFQGESDLKNSVNSESALGRGLMLPIGERVLHPHIRPVAIFRHPLDVDVHADAAARSAAGSRPGPSSYCPPSRTAAALVIRPAPTSGSRTLLFPGRTGAASAPHCSSGCDGSTGWSLPTTPPSAFCICSRSNRYLIAITRSGVAGRVGILAEDEIVVVA